MDIALKNMNGGGGGGGGGGGMGALGGLGGGLGGLLGSFLDMGLGAAGGGSYKGQTPIMSSNNAFDFNRPLNIN